MEIFGNTQNFTGGFHFRSKTDFRTTQFLKGEYRLFDGNVVGFFLKSRFKTQFFNGFSDNNFGGNVHNRNTCHFADVRNRTAGTRIYLNNIHFIIMHDKLDVQKAFHMKGSGQPSGVIFQFFDNFL